MSGWGGACPMVAQVPLLRTWVSFVPTCHTASVATITDPPPWASGCSALSGSLL